MQRFLSYIEFSHLIFLFFFFFNYDFFIPIMLLSISRTFSQAQEITKTELYRPPPSNPAPLLLTKYLVAQLWAFLHKGVTAGLHWRSLSSSPCVKSPLCKYSWCSSSVPGAIFWSEDAKSPGCMEIMMFVWRAIPKGTWSKNFKSLQTEVFT